MNPPNQQAHRAVTGGRHTAEELLTTAGTAPLCASCSKAAIEFDIVDAHRLLATLGLHGHRLSRQFQKTLEQLRSIQAERRERERRDLKEAAELLELHKYKGIPFEPAEHGFVFSMGEIERFLQRQSNKKQSMGIEYARIFGPEQSRRSI